MCFEGVEVFCFLSFVFPFALEYLNPKQIHCTFLSLSFVSLASFCLTDARGESESAHTQNSRSAKKTKTKKKGLWCAFVVDFHAS